MRIVQVEVVSSSRNKIHQNFGPLFNMIPPLPIQVISENASAEKAYFRRGEARMRLNDHEPAREDFAKG